MGFKKSYQGCLNKVGWAAEVLLGVGSLLLLLLPIDDDDAAAADDDDDDAGGDWQC